MDTQIFISREYINYGRLYIEREIVELWAEEFGLDNWRYPGYNHSNIGWGGKLDNGVKFNIEARAVKFEDNQAYYGRNDDWTHVRFDAWPYSNFSTNGKGSRSDETSRQMFDMLAALSNKFEV